MTPVAVNVRLSPRARSSAVKIVFSSMPAFFKASASFSFLGLNLARISPPKIFRATAARMGELEK